MDVMRRRRSKDESPRRQRRQRRRSCDLSMTSSNAQTSDLFIINNNLNATATSSTQPLVRRY